ncbi:ABC transporter permease/substrate-binding protein [Paenibacillus frigoriresistens]|uniref:ABC transporter permease/substrate-binding protein n=1 Tax=Paenibacillus alginolyticus TaxID=59839 RepID=UPI0015660CA6|nr:ABC transporter permease/substrate-binding protein [Paenibacillus frigoriresistens]NRF95998.1 ABC transporter permease/substrate-binding protein [Paenibacillus frigoriresistens]
MNNFFETFITRKAELLNDLIKHIEISFIALIFALLISIPLGIILTRKKRVAEVVIGIAAVFQTIPSLALLGLLIPLVGIGTIPSIIVLVIYALLPILRNIYTGISEVDSNLIEAAKGLGMNNRRLLLKVELPLAMPVIMAGIRTAMVLIIGTATIASLIGAGGLGDLITVGIARNDMNLILIGAIPAALLALFFDFALRQLEKLSFKKSMISVGAVMIAALLLITVTSAIQPKQADIIIGGKVGPEPEILMNMYKILIEENSSLQVDLKPNMGGTTFVYNALTSGSIDIYPEFTGTAIVDLLKEQPSSTDRNDVYKQAEQGLLNQLNLVMLEPMKFNDTYALAVSAPLAKQYNLKTISDLKPVEGIIKAGFTPEFPEREDGYLGIQKLYGIQFSKVNIMQPELRYAALSSGQINVVDAYSTDSAIQQYSLTVLDDDKRLFPPYQGAPLLKKTTLTKYPELRAILNKLAGKITDDEMRKMNYEVAVEKKSAAAVARECLEKNKILSSH